MTEPTATKLPPVRPKIAGELADDLRRALDHKRSQGNLVPSLNALVSEALRRCPWLWEGTGIEPR